MGKDDFFVRFGSDAEIWANNIEKNLDRVNRKVQVTQRLLNGLDKKAIEALGPNGPGGGGGPRGRTTNSLPTGTGPSVESIVEGMAEAASDMKFVAGALKRSIASIDAIPGKLDASIKRLIDKLGAHGRQASGQGPDVDPTQPGSRFLPGGQGVPLGSEGELFWRDMRQRFSAVAGQQPLVNKASIAGVSQGALDKASTDRIVKAINKQTDVLKSRLKNLEVRDARTGGAGDDDGPVTGKRKAKRSGSKADKGVQQVELGLSDYISQTDERIARIGAAINKLVASGASVPDELIKGLDAQRKDRAKMAAALRAEERERSGVSQSAQKAASQKKFREEQRARPVITDEQRDEALRRQALAASPLAPDFDARLGRTGKKNGNYSERDLLAMAETFSRSGVDVKRGRNKQELGANLKTAAAEYFKTHGPEGDPAYRVDSNAIVRKTTKIAGDTAKVLGDLTGSMQESAEAWEIVGKDLKSGGGLAAKALRDTAIAAKTEVGQPRTGNIVVPPGMVKGREERGASRQLGDDAEYARARAVIEEGGRAAARAQAQQLLARKPGIDIYDPKLDAGIQQGTGPGAKGEAITARKRLRAMREYFKEVDAHAQDWFGLAQAMEEGRARQGDLRKSLVSHERVPAGQRTPEHEQEIRRLVQDLDQVDTELRNMETALQRIPGAVRQMVKDPKFQQGLIAREGGLTTGGAAPAGHAFYRSQGTEEALNRRAELEKKVAKATADGSKELPRFRRELEAVIALIEDVEGKESVVRRAEGMGSRQAWETRGPTSRTLSDRRLFQEAGGLALGGSRSLGGKDLVRPISGRVGFSDGRGFYAADDDANTKGGRVSPKQLAKLNQAWGHLAKTIEERDKALRTEGADVDAAMNEVERAADVFAGRFARLGDGLAPSIQSLTGRAPGDEGVAQRDEMRRARREQVEADERRKPTKANRSNVFAYTQDQDVVAGTKRRLSAALERQRVAAEKVTKAEEKLDTVFASLTRTEREEIRVAQGVIDAKEKELNQIERRARIWEGPLSREKIPAREGHSPAAPVDTMGYPSSLGYNPDLQEHSNKLLGELDSARAKRDVLAQKAFDPKGEAGQSAADLRKELDRLRTTVRKEIIARIASARDEGDLKENAGYHAARQDLALNLSQTANLQSRIDESGFGAYDKLAEEASRAAGEVKRLEKELADANTSLGKSTSAWEKRKKQLADERAALVGQGPYKGADLKRLRESKDPASGAEYVAAMTRARRIAEIDREVGGGNTKRQALVETRTLNVAEKERVAALRQERRELQAMPHTRAERKLARFDGNAQLTAQIDERRNRISAIGQELKGLGMVRPTRGSGAGSGDGPPRSPGGATPTGGGGNQISLLRAILAAIKSFHSDVRGGKVAPPTGAAARRTTTTKTVTPSGRGDLGSLAEFSDDPAVQAAIAAQQAVEAARTRTTKPARQPGTQSAQDAAKIRDEIRQKETLAQAYGRVDKKIVEQVNLLRQMTVASKQAGTAEQQHAKQVALAAQQLKVYMAIEEQVAAAGGRGGARRETARALLRDADPALKGKEFDAVAAQARATRGFVDVGSDWAGDAEEGFGGVFGRSGFFKRVIASTGTFIVRNFTAGFVFGLTSAMQQVIDQAIQTEATFVRVSAALQATGKDIGNIRGDLQQISTDYGVQLNDVYDTAAGLAGLFDNTEDLAAATRIVAQLQTISSGALNAQEAMGVLASTISAFEALPGQEDMGNKLLPGGVEGLQKVADVLTVVQNNLGTNVEVTAEGVSRMAGLARQMNLSFEQTAVFTAQIAKQTNQTGAAAGEQFSRILSSLQTGRGRGAVTSAYGEPVEAALAQGDYGKVLEEMIKGWDGLSDSQKRNVAVSVAGQRQAAAFNALMNNGSKTLNVLSKAENANGDATERMDKLMNTLNKRLDVFGTQIQNVASNLVRTGLLNFLGLVLLGANEVFGAVNDILTMFNKFADENAFLGFLRQAITLLLGAGIAIKAVQYGVGGLRGALAGSQMGQNTMAGVAGARTARTARIVAGPARPGWSDYQRQGIVNRSVGFGLDRTVGVGTDATGRGLTGLGNRLNVLNKEVDGTTQATGRFRRGLGMAFQTAGAGTSYLAGGMRDTFQGQANTRLGSAGFAGRSSAYQETADRLRAQIAAGATSGAGGDARLERQARANERLGRANAYAGNTVGRLSDGVNRLGKSGAFADTALIGFTLVLGSVIDGFRDAAALGKSADAGLTRLVKQAKSGEDQRLADRQAEYVGPTAEDYEARLEQMRNDSWFDRGRNRFTAATTAAFKGDPQSLATLGLDSSSINRELGIDPNSQYENAQGIGTKEAEELKKRGERLLKSFGDTTGGVTIAQDTFRKDLGRRAEEIQNDENMSEGQKQAAAAELEQISKSFGDMAADLMATASALGQTYALTVDQIKDVNEAAQAFSSLGGRTAIGDLDLRPLYAELINDTGAEKGSEIGKILERMSNGTSDSVDQMVLNSRLLKAEIKNLYAVWTSKLEEDPEAAEEAKQALMQAISTFGQANTQSVNAIFEQANMLSGQLANVGDFDGAADLWGKALNRAIRIYDNEAEDIKKSMAAVTGRRTQQEQIVAALQAEMDLFGGGGTKGIGGLLLNPMSGSNALGNEPTLPRWKRRWGQFDESNPATEGFAPPVAPGERAEQRQAAAAQRKANDQIIITGIQGRVQSFIEQQTADLRVKSAKEKDPKVKARIDHMIARLTLDILNSVNSGISPEGSGIGADAAERFGDAAVTNEQITGALVDEGQSALAYTQSTKDMALQAAQNAADIQQAQIGVRAAIADARGDTVAAARAQVASARASLALARQQMALAVTPAEVAAARVATLNAQAQLIAANAAVSQAQQDLVQSRFQVAIAIADAAGNSVLAAQRTLQAARQALSAALKKSGGKITSEVNAAKVQAIQAEAALRDAKLQDSLDTIDFNLQMGKITQSAAIAALQEILRTSDLTKQQRRQLLLQIKGMKDEMADSQWNFGAIKLPTPYQMRAYIAARRDQFRNELSNAATGRSTATAALGGGPSSGGGGSTTTTTYNTRIVIPGADIAEVKKVIREVVGGSSATITKTTGARRR